MASEDRTSAAGAPGTDYDVWRSVRQVSIPQAPGYLVVPVTNASGLERLSGLNLFRVDPDHRGKAIAVLLPVQDCPRTGD